METNQLVVRWISDAEYTLCLPIFKEYKVDPPHPAISRIMGAFDGDTLVGIVCVQLLPFFSPMWVDEQYRNTGVGNALGDAIMAELRGSQAEIFCITDNKTIEDMIKRHGFDLKGTAYSVAV